MTREEIAPKLAAFVAGLADRRVKLGVDYAYTFKYGMVRIMCCDVFRDDVMDAARESGIAVSSVSTYRIGGNEEKK